MSHDLRTPLNAIIGFSEMLNMQDFGPLNEKQQRYVGNVLNSGKYLLSLINDILDLSKVEAHKMELYIEEFSIPNVIDEVISTLVTLASNKNINLIDNVDTVLIKMNADKKIFKQILYNFVSNAIKYTPENGTVTIEAYSVDNSIIINIIDNGIGISDENMKELFQPYQQINNLETREQLGTGLGLTLVKKFVELHGGEVWVESEVGKGSTFGFSIPTSLKSTSH